MANRIEPPLTKLYLPVGKVTDMRASSKTRILDAALRVTRREGITGLTLESAAREAGVTKAGLLYHFPGRHELLMAIQHHICDAWETLLLDELAVPYEQADDVQRALAYIRVGLSGQAHSSELAFIPEFASHPELARVWNELMDRWVSVPTTGERPALFAARLVADGLWLLQSSTGARLNTDVRKALRAQVEALLAQEQERV